MEEEEVSQEIEKKREGEREGLRGRKNRSEGGTGRKVQDDLKNRWCCGKRTRRGMRVSGSSFCERGIGRKEKRTVLNAKQGGAE